MWCNYLEFGLQTWRRLYFERHIELGIRAGSVERFLEACSRNESLEVGDYLQAFEIINGARFGFEDIQRFLFKPQMNVLLNLVGVHYCATSLGIPVFHPFSPSFITFPFIIP
jgi:hypothetical protein